MEYLQPVLKKLDGIATLIDVFIIGYFRDGIKSSIHAQLNEKDCDLND